MSERARKMQTVMYPSTDPTLCCKMSSIDAYELYGRKGIRDSVHLDITLGARFIDTKY